MSRHTSVTSVVNKNAWVYSFKEHLLQDFWVPATVLGSENTTASCQQVRLRIGKQCVNEIISDSHKWHEVPTRKQ